MKFLLGTRMSAEYGDFKKENLFSAAICENLGFDLWDVDFRTG